jgi:hypothetical protein
MLGDNPISKLQALAVSAPDDGDQIKGSMCG